MAGRVRRKSPIVLTGDRAVDRRLRFVEAKVGLKVMRKALRNGAKRIAEAAKQTVPRGKTGDLRRAIKVRAMKRSRRRIGVLAMVGEGFFRGETFYGGFVEFGTKHMDGREFMRRAFDTTKRTARDQVLREILSGINGLVRSRA